MKPAWPKASAWATAAACPAFTVQPRPLRYLRDEIGQRFEAIGSTGARLGHVDIEVLPDNMAMTGTAHVLTQYRRCGVGTRLYEAAAAWACTAGHPLRSDASRSAMSEGFWAKQVRRGRAVCAAPAIQWERDAHPFSAIAGRGDCEYYRLTAPCPAPALDGRRRRRRRRR